MSAPFESVSQEDHDAWFDAIRERDDVRIFGIRLRDGDRLVGSCQLHSIHAVHRSAELQIRIGAIDARGRGLGTEATQLLVKYGFDALGLHRVFLHVVATNEVARKLYARVGFRTEGILREAAHIDDDWVDLVLMALLRSDYGTG